MEHQAHTLQDLKMMQRLPLEQKILMTQQRVREWVDEYGIDGVYVSFSGGKDSTVLLDIVRGLFADVKGVFVDTGLEYPEIRDFVNSFENIEIIKPTMNFKRVIEQYGYPVISKEVSNAVADAKKNIPLGKETLRVKQLRGEVEGLFSKSKWLFLVDAPFLVSDNCCHVMKKAPAHKYMRQTGRHPFIGTLAEESQLRTAHWLNKGCNAFNSKYPQSTPLSFWTEQDILQYIRDKQLPICSVYGDVVSYYPEEMDGQLGFDDLGLTDKTPLLKTTGCKRTGCMYCAYGAHLEKESRFELMKKTHPKQYEWIMKPTSEGGLVISK